LFILPAASALGDTVTITGKGNTFTVTKEGKSIQFLMSKGMYQVWRPNGATDWKPMPKQPQIVVH
jgi:hypothetical protein